MIKAPYRCLACGIVEALPPVIGGRKCPEPECGGPMIRENTDDEQEPAWDEPWFGPEIAPKEWKR
jgi:hypothetical protein